MLLLKPGASLKAVSPALVLLALVGVLTLWQAPYLLTLTAPETGQLIWPPEASLPAALSISVLYVLGYAGLAILWHRHTLRPTRPQPITAGLVLSYLWRVLVLGAFQLAFGIMLVVPLLLSAVFVEQSGPEPSSIAKLAAYILTGLLLIWVSLRLSLVLPAAALGQPMTFAESWKQTQRIASPLWGVAFVLTVINTLISGFTNMVGVETATTVLAVQFPLYLLQGLLIFSILTALYSHLNMHETKQAHL